ncbi:MAG: lectin-like protein [Plesiomonas shigelloides]
MFRDSWKWSDEINVVDVSSINWMTGQPDLTGVNRPCGVIRPDGLIDDQLCSNTLPFICKTRKFLCVIINYSQHKHHKYTE